MSIVNPVGAVQKSIRDNEGNLTKHIDRNKNQVDRKFNIDKNLVSLKAYKLEEEAIKKEAEEKAKRTAGKPRHTDYFLRFKASLEAKNRIEEVELTEEEQNKNKLEIIDQRFKYNLDGTIKSAYTNNMEYKYSYNIEGILESKSASGKTLLSYTYDKNNNIKTIKDISGKSSIYFDYPL